MHDAASVEGVQVTGIVEVPQHHRAVLATRGAQCAVGGNRTGVDVPGVSDVVDIQVGRLGFEVPHFDQLVPTSRHDQGVVGIGEKRTEETHSVWPDSWLLPRPPDEAINLPLAHHVYSKA